MGDTFRGHFSRVTLFEGDCLNLVVFEFVNLRDSSGVSATCVWGVDEGLDHGESQVVGDCSLAETHNIGVVMGAREAGAFHIPAKCSPHTSYLVGRDRHPHATATHQDTEAGFVGGHFICHGGGMLGVVG